MGVNALVKKVLNEVGIKPERFSLQWASAAEAPRFVKLITDFTGQIKKLGPLGQPEGLSLEEMKTRTNKAMALVSDIKLRIGFGNITKTMRKEGGKITQARVAELVDQKLSKTISAGLI
ncbi:MAG: hypothetical protein A2511_15425 [Deltaproteobacteria bacterium RIFOXYD12_FULL_50_9]|nr:MAG: hypothetical protein A2511_15425 [Deltaproteobacteria bacterium RIFOXYD12_FULL_50_9]